MAWQGTEPQRLRTVKCGWSDWGGTNRLGGLSCHLGAHLTGRSKARTGRVDHGKAALEMLGLTIPGAPGWVPRDPGVLGTGWVRSSKVNRRVNRRVCELDVLGSDCPERRKACLEIRSSLRRPLCLRA
ncbi:hypothetical protein VULLAG_LOCUS11019 [Vulpes lagopus]